MVSVVVVVVVVVVVLADVGVALCQPVIRSSIGLRICGRRGEVVGGRAEDGDERALAHTTRLGDRS